MGTYNKDTEVLCGIQARNDTRLHEQFEPRAQKYYRNLPSHYKCFLQENMTIDMK